MNCEKCWHGRPIVSENGIHYECMLSCKKAVKCLLGIKSKFTENPFVKEEREEE